jgi:hypothetical protein
MWTSELHGIPESFFSKCVRLYTGKDAEMKMPAEPSRSLGPLQQLSLQRDSVTLWLIHMQKAHMKAPRLVP